MKYFMLYRRKLNYFLDIQYRPFPDLNRPVPVLSRPCPIGQVGLSSLWAQESPPTLNQIPFIQNGSYLNIINCIYIWRVPASAPFLACVELSQRAIITTTGKKQLTDAAGMQLQGGGEEKGRRRARKFVKNIFILFLFIVLSVAVLYLYCM